MNPNGKEEKITTTKDPDSCPLCHKLQTPVYIQGFLSQPFECQIIFRCIDKSCNSFFIAYYQQKEGSDIYHFTSVSPKNPEEIPFEKELKKVSSQYCNIFQEAIFAEFHGLKQIAGMGYRKALEFLVKDYCCKANRGEANKIRKASLGLCIKTYIKDDNITKCAERAAWLGNDESHYVRLWKNKNIADLKKLLILTKNWIIADIQMNGYLRTMKSKPQP